MIVTERPKCERLFDITDQTLSSSKLTLPPSEARKAQQDTEGRNRIQPIVLRLTETVSTS
eukprot:scaffold13326_cov204-Alexandrium_tamarense.AAC.42